MHGMAISTLFSMNIGLTIGVLFGAILQGNLFYSTIYSMFTGILIGLLCGIGLGLLPSIEGTMSGLMGGMMGAMLGEMIPADQISLLLIILLTLSLCSLLLFFILPKQDKKDHQINSRFWLIKPLIIFGVISAYLIFGFNLSKDVANTKKHTNNEFLGKEETKDIATINIETINNKYSPSTIEVRKNKQISLVLTNLDSIEHDFEIKDISIKNLGDKTGHRHSTAALHLHALPKSHNKLNFIPLKTGIYEFYCTIPGHKEAGMTGVMKVIRD